MEPPFFENRPHAELLFDALRDMVDSIGETTLASTKSRISFVRRTRFLWIHETTKDGIWLGFKMARKIEEPGFRVARKRQIWFHHVKVTSVEQLQGLKPYFTEAFILDS